MAYDVAQPQRVRPSRTSSTAPPIVSQPTGWTNAITAVPASGSDSAAVAAHSSGYAANQPRNAAASTSVVSRAVTASGANAGPCRRNSRSAAAGDSGARGGGGGEPPPAHAASASAQGRDEQKRNGPGHAR